MTDLDISDTLAPKSDQLDAVDLLGGPQTFTITEVTRNNADQPINVRLAEFPRVWRPGKSMRRVMASMWGTKTAAWVGQRVTLFCDPDVRFGGEAVGGTRISHATGISKPHKTPLLVTRGKSSTYTVQPLKDAPKPPEQPSPTAEDVASATTEDELRAMWSVASPQVREAITARVAELKAAAEPEPAEDADPNPGAPWGGDVA